jgi:hypothetical protein
MDIAMDEVGPVAAQLLLVPCTCKLPLVARVLKETVTKGSPGLTCVMVAPAPVYDQLYVVVLGSGTTENGILIEPAQ